MPPGLITSPPLSSLDLSRAEYWRDGLVGPLFERLRAEDPVHFCRESPFGPYWSVTRHSEIVEVERQPDLFSSSYRHGGVTLFGDNPSWFPMFIAMDGAQHKAQRATVAPAFAPSRMSRLAPFLKRHVDEVVGSLPLGETFDWAERVSGELSTQMLAELLGVPYEHRQKLIYWSDWAADLRAIVDPALARKRLEILWECAGFFLGLWRAREKEGTGTDLISMMVRSEATRAMAPQQYLGNLILLVVGGTDTTRNAMSALPPVVRKWPEQWRKLAADPALAASAALELIRWQTPLAHMRRTAIAPCELAGRAIAAGDKVVLWYLSGNRDSTVFDEPDRFIGDRANVRQHLAFGFGVHRCVGARLAELQIAALIQALLERGLRPVQAGKETLTANCFSHGFSAMPARLERA
jgi:cytochrome P450